MAMLPNRIGLPISPSKLPAFENPDDVVAFIDNHIESFANHPELLLQLVENHSSQFWREAILKVKALSKPFHPDYNFLPDASPFKIQSIIHADWLRNKRWEIYNHIVLYHINEEEFHLSIALNAVSTSLRVASTAKIINETLLVQIFKSNSDEEIRSLCAMRIQNQEFLFELAHGDVSEKLRAIAVAALKDAPALKRFALEDRHLAVRVAALKSLVDVQEVWEHLKHDSNPEVRLALIKQVNDQELLVEALQHETQCPSSNAHQTILKYILERLEMPTVELWKLVKARAWVNLRMEFIQSKFTADEHQPILEEIAATDKDPSVVVAAVARLNSAAILKNIYNCHANQNVRIAAARRLETLRTTSGTSSP